MISQSEPHAQLQSRSSDHPPARPVAQQARARAPPRPSSSQPAPPGSKPATGGMAQIPQLGSRWPEWAGWASFKLCFARAARESRFLRAPPSFSPPHSSEAPPIPRCDLGRIRAMERWECWRRSRSDGSGACIWRLGSGRPEKADAEEPVTPRIRVSQLPARRWDGSFAKLDTLWGVPGSSELLLSCSYR